MAAKTETVANVRQKLAKARLLFLQRNVKKSGKNIKLEFMYYELSDIVPEAIEIFAELGLVYTTEFTDGVVTMAVYNADNPEEEPLNFILPYKEVDVILNREGKAVTNPLQALGATITYLRRYLWMLVLDIAEHDDIDANLTDEPEEKVEKKIPATVEERKEIKEELVKQNAPAEPSEKVNQIKDLCKQLMGKDDKQEDFVTQIAMATDGFTKEPEDFDADALIGKLNEILAEYK